MARIRASKKGLEYVDSKRRLKGWTAESSLWISAAGTSRATLKRFRNGSRIDRDVFIDICKAVGIENWEDIVDNILGVQSDFIPDFFDFDTWVGQEREQLVTKMSEKIHGSCRLSIILGITGIGKTALAKRLAMELKEWFGGDWKNCWRRINLTCEDKPTDFASVATEWLEGWGEKLSSDERKPEKLLDRLLKYLINNQVLVLIDSMESLLTGSEYGWGDFVDQWWCKFFSNILSAEHCKSRFIITSQDLPINLLDSRVPNFWQREILGGLSESEQIDLFNITGLETSDNSHNRSLLLRMGKIYRGHPLILRIIIGEILNEPFSGNIQAYWNDERENVSQKIEEVEKDLIEAEEGLNLGEEDEWKLHKLTRKIRNDMYEKRLKITFDRLEKNVNDAYILICAASVYRSPEKEKFWIEHLIHWIYRLEKIECGQHRQEAARQELSNRFLIVESINDNGQRKLEQHSLIRSVSIEHRKQLTKNLQIM